MSNQEAVVQGCSIKMVLLVISQNSQENRPFNKVAGLQLWHRCFPVNFAKFLRTTFYKEYLWWLLLAIPYSILDKHLQVSRNQIIFLKKIKILGAQTKDGFYCFSCVLFINACIMRGEIF